jgi:hypothetical protein
VGAGGQSSFEQLRIHHPLAQQDAQEGQVALSAGHQFGAGEIVHLHAPARRAAGVLVVQPNQAGLPASRQHCRRIVHAMGVVAEGLVELRQLPNRPVDEVGLLDASRG